MWRNIHPFHYHWYQMRSWHATFQSNQNSSWWHVLGSNISGYGKLVHYLSVENMACNMTSMGWWVIFMWEYHQKREKRSHQHQILFRLHHPMQSKMYSICSLLAWHSVMGHWIIRWLMNKAKTKILLWLNSCKLNLKNRRRDSFLMRKLSLAFWVVFSRLLFVLLSVVFLGHCLVRPSTYGFSLTLWYVKPFLADMEFLYIIISHQIN